MNIFFGNCLSVKDLMLGREQTIKGITKDATRKVYYIGGNA